MEKFYSVEKLNNTNYGTWKFEMKMLLIKEDLWSLVCDGVPDVQTKTWLKGNNKALATISLGVEKTQFPLIMQCVYALDAWNKLQDHHVQKSIVSKVSLLKKIFAKKFQPGENMDAHLLELEQLFESLEVDQQVKFPDLWRSVVVLASLPECYGSLVVSLESRKEEELTLNLVKQKVLDETERQLNVKKEVIETSTTAFLASNRSLKCWICGKIGHTQYNCPDKVEEREGKSNAAFCMLSVAEKFIQKSVVGFQTSNIMVKDGDWLCGTCKNVNYGWRKECNRCCSEKRLGVLWSSTSNRNGSEKTYDQYSEPGEVFQM